MLNDSSTDLLYLADTLPKKYPTFYKEFVSLLIQSKTQFKLIPGTKDIWARDYMPIQNGAGELVKFDYKPDYLSSKKYINLITDAKLVCKKLGYEVIEKDLVLDGGNVVHYGNKIVVCDKVLAENKNKTKKEITRELRQALRVNNIVYIPTQENDLFGHADGIVRFIDSKTIIINRYRKEDSKFEKELRTVLQKLKLNIVELPYNPYKNKSIIQANGVYINFLQMKGKIFFPVFGLKEDEEAIKLISSYFPKSKIYPIDSNEIANDGGVLNCISWNIKDNYPDKIILTDYEREVERDLLNLWSGIID